MIKTDFFTVVNPENALTLFYFSDSVMIAGQLLFSIENVVALLLLCSGRSVRAPFHQPFRKRAFCSVLRRIQQAIHVF